MPLPSDPQLVSLSEDIIEQLGQIFGSHAGYRPVHARGLLLTGSFTPTTAAAEISSAPHFHCTTTPVTARFSSSTGLPQIPDTDPNGNPRGLAIRFNLAEHVHTDIVAHSTPAFPVRTGQEFLDFFRAVGNGNVPEFLASHPAAAYFVQYPKPNAESLATEAYYALHAFKFTNEQGGSRYGRYTILPEAGLHYLDEAKVKEQTDNYLYDEIPSRLEKGPVVFNLVLQLADEGDTTNDVTVQWSKERKSVVLGTVSLDKVVEENKLEQKKIIYDPVPRVVGIESAGDPLLEVRAAVYLIGGRKRRAAADS